MEKKFYITTAIPYVNSSPHVGHALEFVQADVIARYHRLLGDNVLLLSGGDENALKNVQAAKNDGTPVQEFIDRNTELFRQLAIKLNVQFDVFQKGSDTLHHYPSSQKLWRLCEHDIYKKSYEGLYCVGCEAFYTPDELDQNGECFEHPGKKLETVKEENYFFKLSKYQKPLFDCIQTNKLHIIPEKRKNEVLSFLAQGLTDISISRSNERAKEWGVPVPDDNTQRMYVWFDALNIYQSGIGFGWDDALYKKWWPADVHVIGKGITRFHAVYWPAFLLSAGLKLPKNIFVHEYFTVNGQKMSKTLGNVIDPIELINKYGADPLRYYFLAKFSPFSDGDFSEKEFRKTYNADLANGIGNTVSRVAKLCETSAEEFPYADGGYEIRKPVAEWLKQFKFNDALHAILSRFSTIDNEIDRSQPWKLSGTERKNVLIPWVEEIRNLVFELKPFIPQTAEKILKQFGGPTITSQPPLFPRIS